MYIDHLCMYMYLPQKPILYILIRRLMTLLPALPPFPVMFSTFSRTNFIIRAASFCHLQIPVILIGKIRQHCLHVQQCFPKQCSLVL